MLRAQRYASAFIPFFLLTACGGGGSSPTPDPAPTPPPTPAEPEFRTGYFYDSVVAGLEVKVDGESAFTDSEGSFTTESNQIASFSVNGLTLGELSLTESSQVVTPMDLFDTDVASTPEVVNTLIVLQSLDADQNPVNGIDLTAVTNIDALDLSTLNISSSNFTDGLTQALANADHPYIRAINVVNAIDASAHFNDTLLDLAERESKPWTGTVWIERREAGGEIQGRWEFISDTEMTFRNYHTCSGEPFSLSDARTMCQSSTKTMSWSLSGNTLTLSTSNNKDTCKFSNIGSRKLKGRCNFYGSGLGYEDTRLSLYSGTLSTIGTSYYQDSDGFALIFHGAESFYNYVFSDDGTGTIHAPIDGEIGLFSWQMDGEQLLVSQNLANQSSDTLIFTFIDEINGSYLTTVEINNEVGEALLIAGVAPSDSLFVKRYYDYGIQISDIHSPRTCKAYYYYDPAKDYVMDVTGEDTEQSCILSSFDFPDDATANITDLSPGAKIKFGDFHRLCWPISTDMVTNGEDPARYFKTVACANSERPEFDVEVWEM